MRSLRNNIQLVQEFLKSPFLFLYFSYYTLMTWWCYLKYCYVCRWYYSLLKRDQACHLWQQLELASKHKSDLQGTGLGRKWLIDFNAEKPQLVSFDWPNSTGAIDVKMDGSVREKSSFEMLVLTFSSKLD